jgi:FkbM family methyltransferase
MNSSQTPPSDLSAQPFGAFAAKGLLARMIDKTRTLGAGWLDKRIASALRKLAMKQPGGNVVDTETLGAKMRLMPHNNLCDKRILFTPQLFDVVEREWLSRAVTQARNAGRRFCFVDIGANVGAYSLHVAALAGPGARILAVEPQPDIFTRLTANIGFNPFGTVKAVACAVADKPSELTLFLDPRNKGESSVRLLRSSAAMAVKVPATTLHQLLLDEGYDRLDAIKLDVEGAEDLIIEPFLRQAPEALWPKLIVIEDSASRWQVDLRSLLQAKGYREKAHTRLNFVYERD